MPQDGDIDEVDDLDTDEQGSTDQDADGQDSDADNGDGFDGEFDAKRARTLIDRLRNERNRARDEAKNAKNSPELTTLQKENLRLRVAISTGLDADIADRLRGDTEDELLEDAQNLIDRFFPKDKKLEDRTPKPRLRGGSTPGKDPELTPEEIVKQALGR